MTSLSGKFLGYDQDALRDEALRLFLEGGIVPFSSDEEL